MSHVDSTWRANMHGQSITLHAQARSLSQKSAGARVPAPRLAAQRAAVPPRGAPYSLDTPRAWNQRAFEVCHRRLSVVAHCRDCYEFLHLATRCHVATHVADFFAARVLKRCARSQHAARGGTQSAACTGRAAAGAARVRLCWPRARRASGGPARLPRRRRRRWAVCVIRLNFWSAAAVDIVAARRVL